MVRFTKGSWKDNVHPAFVEIAEMYREHVRSVNHLRDKSDPRAVAEIRKRAVQNILEIRKRYPNLPEGIYSVTLTDPPNLPIEELVNQLPTSISRGILEWLCWRRFRRPLRQIVMEDNAGIRESSRIIEHIIAEGNKLRYGEQNLLPGFKFDLDHSGLLEMGLSLGLAELGAEELAQCFDEVCPCGKVHSADSLKKQRNRLLKDIEAAKAWEGNPPDLVRRWLQTKKVR